MPALFQEAVREQIKLRAAIDGPTGAGKTWTALQFARILAGPNGTVALGDTEHRSSLRYAPAPGESLDRDRFFDPPYTFKRLDLTAPYNPVGLAELINRAPDEIGEDGVLIVDSLTHYWVGEGGTLDIVDQARLKGFNGFTAWQEGTPPQRFLLYSIVQCRCHLICTMRSKMEYAMEENTDTKGNRKSTVTKKGMAPEQRSGIEYEFDLIVSMDLSNRAEVTKSRIPGLMGTVFHPGRSYEMGEALADWLATGAPLISTVQVEAIRAAIGSLPTEEDRVRVRRDFVAKFGRKPADLLASDAEAAASWVAGQIAAAGKLAGPLADAVDATEPDEQPSLQEATT